VSASSAEIPPHLIQTQFIYTGLRRRQGSLISNDPGPDIENVSSSNCQIVGIVVRSPRNL
jgi:hypothetical protein